MPFNQRRDAYEYQLISHQEDIFGRIFDLTPIPIILVDDKWSVLKFNSSSLSLIKTRSRQAFENWFLSNITRIKSKFKVTTGFNEYDVLLKDLHHKSFDVLVRVKAAGKKQYIITLEDITTRKSAEKHLTRMAQIDGLTGLLNHKTIVMNLQQELLRAKQYHLPFSCLLVDVDDFKVINDRFGHLKGDQILKKVSTALKVNLRESDIVGRYGGDEFLVILTETPIDQAHIPARRISEYLIKHQPVLSKDVILSFSIGISGFNGKGVVTSKKLIALADKGLYVSKKKGGNKIVVNEKVVK